MPTILQNLVRHRAIVAVMLVASCFAAPGAHAQWAVRDDDANTKLQEIQNHTDNLDKATGTTDNGGGKTLNGNLDAINNKLKIGAYKAEWPGPRVKDPASALPADTTTLNDGSACNVVNQKQQDLCKQIVAIENAQYQYMLTMYANTNTRDAVLRKLLEERQAISADDANQYGKLEDNTNKLTALYNLMQLDQQQMQSVNYAYEANLRYLRAKQALAATSANTGEDVTKQGFTLDLPIIGTVDAGSLVTGFATGAALELALDGVATKTPSGMKTLNIGQSNGYGL